MEFLLVKLGLAAALQFIHGFLYTYITGRPLEQESSAEQVQQHSD